MSEKKAPSQSMERNTKSNILYQSLPITPILIIERTDPNNSAPSLREFKVRWYQARYQKYG